MWSIYKTSSSSVYIHIFKQKSFVHHYTHYTWELCWFNTLHNGSFSYSFFFFFIFFLAELKATIIGPTDLYVKSGSDINLTCKIMQGPHELGNIFWYKGNLLFHFHFLLLFRSLFFIFCFCFLVFIKYNDNYSTPLCYSFKTTLWKKFHFLLN